MDQPAPKSTVAVIGAGPAGLMAAEAASMAGASVTIYDQMPSPARKFLMAGKSGLNITNTDPDFASVFKCLPLNPMIEAFGPRAIRDWMTDLDQPSFVGSTGRVFPEAMKASPLLRAWLSRLEAAGVTLHRRARWTGWDGAALTFADSTRITPDATVLAMGGASWHRLGSDGAWAAQLPDLTTPFLPSNIGFRVDWSDHMTRHFGSPLKNTGLIVGGHVHRGEVTISAEGIEGGGLYPLTPALREGAALAIDLKPDLTEDDIRTRLSQQKKQSLPNALRRALRFTPLQTALLQEFGRPLPDDLAPLIKHLPVPLKGPRDMDQAISTAGGLRWDAVDETLMLRSRPGTFAAGEMLDWEAPTGGWLLTACLATGRWAGQAAARYSAR